MASRPLSPEVAPLAAAAQRTRVSPRLALELIMLRLGWCRAIAIAVLLGCAAVHFLVAPELARRGESFRQESSSLRAGTSEAPAMSAQDERYAAFRATLAPGQTREDLLKSIFTEAEAAGIKLSQGDHEWSRDDDGAFDKMRLSLPLKGSAGQIRQFLYAILARLPNAALDQISLRRDNIKTNVIEARVQLTVYFKDTD